MPHTVKETAGKQTRNSDAPCWPVLPDWWADIPAWDPGDLDNWYHPELLDWSADIAPWDNSQGTAEKNGEQRITTRAGIPWETRPEGSKVDPDR